jgi:hypothetical protein
MAMAAMPPEPTDAGMPEGSAPPAGAGPEAQRRARYTYLVGRLRGRQITMEEATELFASMQAMIRAGEVARRTAAPVVPSPPPGLSRVRGPVVAPAAADDLFLIGILAMGAGAGMLAAMARRLAEPAAAPSGDAGTPARRSA